MLGEELDDLEDDSFRGYQVLRWRTFENSFYQARKGLLEDGEWQGYRRLIVQNLNSNHAMGRFVDDVWVVTKNNYSLAFVEEIEGLRNLQKSQIENP